MKNTPPLVVLLLSLTTLSFLPATSLADAVTEANHDVLQAIRLNATPPPKASRAMAILHTSLFDAVNGVVGRYTPYSVAPAAPTGASADAAAAAAVNSVMNSLFPAQSATWTANYNNRIAALPATQATIDGVAWGSLVANAILLDRSTDGHATALPAYTGSTDPGAWRPTSAANGLLPHWGSVEPFGISSSAAFLPPPPLPLDSAAYARQFDEVKDYGSATSTLRSADQTLIAQFWADGGGTETPPGHWNAIAENVLPATNELVDNARIFAAMNVALADAAIVAWDAKYTYSNWRPVTAIREAANDGNALTLADPTWTSLLGTPPFPDHVSGHSSFSGAAATVLAGLLGTDNISFTTDSDALGTGITRSFTSFSGAADEAGRSRVYGGIHFEQANQDGLALGRQVGSYILANHFAPINATNVPEPSATSLLLVALASLARRRRCG